MLVTLLTIDNGLIPMHFSVVRDWYLTTHAGSTIREAEEKLREPGFIIDGIRLLIETEMGMRDITTTGSLFFHKTLDAIFQDKSLAYA